MNQVSQNVIVLQMGDPMPEGTEDAIKILLVGTESVDTPTANGEAATYDWQKKFIDGVVDLTGQDGMLMFKNKNYIIINCKYIPKMMPTPNMPGNTELLNKYNYILDMANQADGIFCNILKKTTSPIPMFEFGLFLSSNKLVVRCSEEYPYSSLIKLVCERNNVPLLFGKSSVKDALFSFFAGIPKFQELKKYDLPE